MKRKQEENLIKLAFGDIDPKDAERAKELLVGDAEANKLFAGYSEIREGLKQLHTPEHQLSTERLREAILRDGLKNEKSSASGWRWTLAPVAVAAAAMLITLRFGGHSSPDVAFLPTFTNDAGKISLERGPDISPSSTQRPMEFTPRDVARGAADAAIKEIARGEVAAPKKIANTEAITASLHRSEPKSEAAKPVVSPDEMSHMAIEGALPAGALAMSFDSGEEQPIVLIGTENDEATGANRATEVSSANNVIVGG